MSNATCIAAHSDYEDPWSHPLRHLATSPDAEDPANAYLMLRLGGQVGSMGETEEPFLCFARAADALAFIEDRQSPKPAAWLLLHLPKTECATRIAVFSQYDDAMARFHAGTLVEDIQRKAASLFC